jgi:hypothetical protein
MTTRSWFRTLFARTPRSARKAAARCRPRFEALEDRVVPATFHVTSLADATAGSLRAAIAAANLNPGPDTIDFQVSGTLPLAGLELPITDSVSIVGPGADALTISGSYLSRVFDVFPNTEVNISSLRIAYGASGASGGGGILNAGRLTLTDVVIDHNLGTLGGGGILNSYGQLTLERTVIDSNLALGVVGVAGYLGHINAGDGTGANGGGLATLGGSVTISDSTFQSNTALAGAGGSADPYDMGFEDSNGFAASAGNGGTAQGGGLYAGFGAVVTVTNSTFNNNQAQGGKGGAVAIGVAGTPGFSGNGGEGHGGGLYAELSAVVTVINSTLAGNAAIGGQGAQGGDSVGPGYGYPDFLRGHGGNGGNAAGGGLMVDATSLLTVTNATVVSNHARAGYGGPGGWHAGSDGNPIYYPQGDDGNGVGGGLYITLTAFQQAVQDALMVDTIDGGAPSDPPSGPDPIPARVVNNTIAFANVGFRRAIGSTGPHDVADDYSGLPSLDHDLIGVDPKLGPLADNGGPTRTMALLATSPAIDAGSNTAAVDAQGHALSTDQRGTGFARLNGTVDIGAFEVQSTAGSGDGSSGSGEQSAATSTALSASTATSVYGQPVTFTTTVTSGDSAVAAGTVVFSSGATVLGVVDVNASGQAVYSTSTLTVAGSPYTITAVYNPSGPYLASSDSTTLTVTPAIPSLTVNPIGLTYGTALDSTQLVGTATAQVNGQTVSVPGTFAFTSDAGRILDASATAYGEGVTFTPADAANFSTATGVVSVSIARADLCVKATPNSKTYGTAAADTGAVRGVVNNDGITATFASAGDAATAPVGTGSYTISATLADPNGRLSNYTVHPTTATLTVNKADLTVMANPNSKTYGQPASDTGSLSGVVSGDGITASFASPGDAATAPVGSGSYTISATLANPNGRLSNYTVHPTTAMLTVNKADLNVMANPNSKFYHETATDSGTLSGVVNGDGITATFSSPGDPASAAVGQYTISATLADPYGKLSNYTVHQTTATLTVLSYADATTRLLAKVDAAGLDAGTQNALDSKLQAALDSFGRGNTSAAVSQLRAFLNLVSAQRGKKIAADQADDFIASAQRVINAVG